MPPRKAIPTDLQDLVDRMRGDCNAIAVQLRTLQDRLSTQMSQQDVDTLKAQLTNVAAAMEAFGDPNNVVVPPFPDAATTTSTSTTDTTTTVL